jgi:pyruvate dehydrogenase E2 component (dihydrolipoamide acetyltransferase)
MPETGSGHGAAVVAWLKHPGERVEAEEPICLVAWDEFSAEVTSPAAGVLRMLAVAPGEGAATGASLAVIDVGVRSPIPEVAEPPAAAPEPEPIEPEPEPEPQIYQPELEPIASLEPEPVAATEPVPEALVRDAPVGDPEPVELGGFLSPAVRRFAGEHGVDPALVAGTGRDGRVTLRDLAGEG